MGRAKLDLITNKKSRTLAFKKRKESLMKKMHELTTLCDVKACMIIYSKIDDDDHHEPAQIWPQNNPDEIRRMISLYKEYSGNNTYSLSDFFKDRNKRIEDELSKARKKSMEAKYPTWVESLDSLSEVQLRDFGFALRLKSEILKSRIGLLKKRNEQGLISQSWAFSNPQEDCDRWMMMKSMAGPGLPEHVPMYYGGNNTVFYDSMAGPGLAEPAIRNFPTPVSNYYGHDGGNDEVFYGSMVGPGLAEPPVICNVPTPVSKYYGPAGGGNNEVFYCSMVGPGLAEPVICNVTRPVSNSYGSDVLMPVPSAYVAMTGQPRVQFDYHGSTSDGDIFQY